MDSDIVVRFIPATKWYKRARWELRKDYISKNKNVTVTKGFITDGASIPCWARLLFSPTGRYFSAAIIHDFILVTKKNWPIANTEFEAELKLLKIANWRKNALIMSVKLWARVLGLFGKNSLND